MRVASGLTCEQTAGLFGDSPRTLVNWVRRFDRQGLAGLAEGNHSGRPARLSAEQWEEARGWVRQPPAAAAVVDANRWDGKSVAAFLRKRYGVPLSVRQCQRLFRLVDTRYRLRRPLVAKGDPQRQTEHKTPGMGTRSGPRPLVFGRSAFLPAWFPLPDVGAVGRGGSGVVA